MEKTTIFDSGRTRRISECRREVLESLLQDLSGELGLETGLDAGCGVGFFSNYLSKYGLDVTAFDAREENIADARKRHAEVEFVIHDVEDPHIEQLGQYDLVLCFGLLYHLENPFRAIRNLYGLTKKVLIAESMVTPHQSPIATLMSESPGEDQSLHYIAFVPSESCLIKMLYRAGFVAVYKVADLPDHEQFQETSSHKRRRTILVASKVKLELPKLQGVPEPALYRPDIWKKKWVSQVRDFGHLPRMILSKLGTARRLLFP